jgi:hypothetical protein
VADLAGVGGLELTALARGHLELDALALFEALVALALDLTEVDEEVVSVLT